MTAPCHWVPPIKSPAHLQIVTRYLSNTSSHWRAPARSPRVARKERVIERGLRPTMALPQADAGHQWPVEIIQHALKESKGAISTGKAISTLNGFVALKQSKGIEKKHVEKFVEDHEITPSVLSSLARVLLRAGDQRFRRLVADLFVAASSLDDETAILFLAEEAFKDGKPELMNMQSLQSARVHLGRLAEAQNPSAMILLAKGKELHGKHEEALELYQEAGSLSETMTSSQYDESSSIPGEAWASAGRLMGKMSRVAEEQRATEKAAVMHDNPEAYYTLALKFRKPTENQYLEYMLKAAGSGIGDAAYKVGLWYLDQTGGQSSTRHIPSTMAQEWFQVAAESPKCQWKPLAKLHIARMLYEQGDLTSAKQLLEEAAETPSAAVVAIAWLRSCWNGSQRGANSMTGLEFEALLSGESPHKE